MKTWHDERAYLHKVYIQRIGSLYRRHGAGGLARTLTIDGFADTLAEEQGHVVRSGGMDGSTGDDDSGRLPDEFKPEELDIDEVLIAVAEDTRLMAVLRLKAAADEIMREMMPDQRKDLTVLARRLFPHPFETEDDT